MKHKLLSILLCLAMALSLLSTAALAAEGTTEVKFTPKDGTEVTYKKAEDANGNITVYVTEMITDADGINKFVGVESEEEWSKIKDVLRELAK